MDKTKQIDDLIKFLDEGFSSGTGHVNVNIEENDKEEKETETFGCTDCSRTPLACSVPTLHEGLDDFK